MVTRVGAEGTKATKGGGDEKTLDLSRGILNSSSSTRHSDTQPTLLVLQREVSEAPQGHERGAIGSKTSPAHYNPCVSLLSMVLRTLVAF